MVDGVRVELTPEEIAELEQVNFDSSPLVTQDELARDMRNALLLKTDWTQGKDISDSISTPWASYRQALRDVPTQAGFPNNIQWPTQPE